MTKIKIRSNPYNREISYLTMDEATGQWVDVRETDERSRLRETDSERSFLPFKIKEIITIIIKEYYVGREKVQLYFEGTQDEYYEVEAVCESDDVKDKIELIRTNTILENARFIKGDIKEVFERVNPVIENIMKEDFSVKRGLNKVSQALDDVIPLCVFGNYSAGKSTFINALIGVELLPSGGDPVTAKIYEIRNSEFFDQAKISFEFHGERIEISIEGKEFRVLKGDSETDIVKSIKEEIDNEGSHELYAMVRIAMDILNNYEKKDKKVTEIGSVITLVVPFSTSGVIGNSSNKFVIFDTPGSNSNSNQDHAKVLAEAMDGFSNGIPLWVTQYDAHDTKRALILQITNTDALSDSQREEIADMIQNYDVNNFKEQADSVFVRKRFLKGNLLGIRINDDEKLDIKRLARSYNDRIKRIVNDMSQSMNEDCFSQFKIWEEKLLAKINANLTELNPELKSLAEIIRIETENITELENNQTMIQASLDTIKDLMSWKEAEEE